MTKCNFLQGSASLPEAAGDSQAAQGRQWTMLPSAVKAGHAEPGVGFSVQRNDEAKLVISVVCFVVVMMQERC